MRFENLNQSKFKGLLTKVNESTITDHIKTMLRPNTWATHVEVMAAATYFQVPVYFLTQADVLKWKVVRALSGCSDFRFPHPAGTPAVQTVITHFELVYYPNRHYDCVVSVCGDRGVPIIVEEHTFTDEVL